MDRITGDGGKKFIPAHMRSEQSFTQINHNIHPSVGSKKYIGHHDHIRELAAHVLRGVPNHQHMIEQVFGDPKIHISGQPYVQRNYDTKFGIPWL